jgi:uncharacterized protein (TIGR03000 family)
LLINGRRTAQRGGVRTFVSPPLSDGHRFFYDLLALRVEDGKQAAARRKVPVYPGERVTVDFAAAEPEEPAVFGPPRKLAQP